jgi:hypothetical protein
VASESLHDRGVTIRPIPPSTRIVTLLPLEHEEDTMTQTTPSPVVRVPWYAGTWTTEQADRIAVTMIRLHPIDATPDHAGRHECLTCGTQCPQRRWADAWIRYRRRYHWAAWMRSLLGGTRT